MKKILLVALWVAFSCAAFGQGSTVVGACNVAIQPCKVYSLAAPLTGQVANISTPVTLYTNNTGASVQLQINDYYWQTTTGTGTVIMTFAWNDGRNSNSGTFGGSCDLSTICHANMTVTLNLASGQSLSYTTSGYTSGVYAIDVTVTRTR